MCIYIYREREIERDNVYVYIYIYIYIHIYIYTNMYTHLCTINRSYLDHPVIPGSPESTLPTSYFGFWNSPNPDHRNRCLGHTYIYIYIEREREIYIYRERYIYICIESSKSTKAADDVAFALSAIRMTVVKRRWLGRVYLWGC